MKYPYDISYQPPFPVAQVAFYNSEEGLRTASENALLDTGSDGSLVPIAYLRQILAPALTDTRIRSHWGEWRPAQLFVVDLELGNMRLPGVFVVGDEQGNEIVLGRNILNGLSILFDGPAKLTDIPSQ
jgi:predicted aspartyl protease